MLNKLKEPNDYIGATYDDRTFKRGEIYYIDLEDINEITAHVSHKSRPALIIQNDKGNVMSPTLIVALLTTAIRKDYPFQFRLTINGRDTIIMFEQILTIDKNRIKEKYSELSPQQMKEADLRLMYSLQLDRLSLANIVGVDVLSLISKKDKDGERIYFEIRLLFQRYNHIVEIDLDALKEFDPSITESTSFEELAKMLDCCKGISWLINNSYF